MGGDLLHMHASPIVLLCLDATDVEHTLVYISRDPAGVLRTRFIEHYLGELSESTSIIKHFQVRG